MNRQQPQRQNDLAMWYNSIPVCTRFLFTSFIAITLAGNLGLVDIENLLYFPRDIFARFQIWRLYTPFFLFSFNVSGAIQLFFLYKYSVELETTRFAGRTADYVYFLLVEAGLIL
ncbi:2264_t:CDS:2, partial [Acaulospora morrowiae]